MRTGLRSRGVLPPAGASAAKACRFSACRARCVSAICDEGRNTVRTACAALPLPVVRRTLLRQAAFLGLPRCAAAILRDASDGLASVLHSMRKTAAARGGAQQRASGPARAQNRRPPHDARQSAPPGRSPRGVTVLTLAGTPAASELASCAVPCAQQLTKGARRRRPGSHVTSAQARGAARSMRERARRAGARARRDQKGGGMGPSLTLGPANVPTTRTTHSSLLVLFQQCGVRFLPLAEPSAPAWAPRRLSLWRSSVT